MTSTLPCSPVQAPLSQRAVALLGLGTAVPASLTQDQVANFVESISCRTAAHSAWLQRVYAHAGVARRGSVLVDGGLADFYPPPTAANPHGPSTAVRMERYAREAPPLAQRAASAALAHAGLAPAAITHLITVSCTGFCAPGLDIALITRLGLPPHVRRQHLGFMGCHAAFNALAAAQDAIRADPYARVLVCCVELSSLHFAYGAEPEKLVANALFADGAAAAVVGPVPVHTAAPPILGRLLATASLLLPDSQDAMTWRIGDHGFAMTLSAELPAIIAAHLRPWCESWLGDLGLVLSDISRWAIHPGGPRILTAARSALGLPAAALAPSFAILAQHGNMSSATILFLLQYLAATPVIADSAAPSDSLCVALGFGPGLMAEAMLLTV